MMKMDYFTNNTAIYMPHRKSGNLFEMKNLLSSLVQVMHHTAYFAPHKRIATARVVPRGLEIFGQKKRGGSHWDWNNIDLSPKK
jgi:hypothetical protein